MKKYTLLLLFFGGFVSFNPLVAQSPSGLECDSVALQQAHDFNKKGNAHLKNQQYEEAVKTLHLALAGYHNSACKSSFIGMELNILKAELKQKNWKQFEQSYQQFLQGYDSATTKANLDAKGQLYYVYSWNALNQKQFEQAKASGLKSLELHKRSESWQHYFKTATHLALVAYYQQDFAKMEQMIDLAATANKEQLERNKKNLREITQLYGALYYKTGDYQKALTKTKESLQQAFSTMETDRDSNYVAALYNNIGLYYMELGDVTKAEDYCTNALQLSQRTGNYYEVSTIYLNMGELFDKRQNAEKAFFYYKQSVKALEKVKGVPQHKYDRALLNINNNIAAVAIQLKRYGVALDALQKNLIIHQKDTYKTDETFAVLGRYYTAIKQYSTAEKFYGKALLKRQEIYGWQHPLVAEVYYELAIVARKQLQPKIALQQLQMAQEAITIVYDSVSNTATEEISDQSTFLQILDAKARIYQEEERTLLAFLTTQKAVATVEELRAEFKEEGSKLFILQKMIPTYELSLALSLELYKTTAEKAYLQHAFQLIEKSKSVLLLDALQVEQARSFGNVPTALLEEENRLARALAKAQKELFDSNATITKAKIAAIHKEILELKLASEKLQQQLEQNYPKYHELKYSTQLASLEQVQQLLDAETALIEYFVGNNNVYVFSIYKDSVWLSTMPVNLGLTNSIRALRTALTQTKMLRTDSESSYALLANNARTIYKQYVAPALKSNLPQKLIIIPDGGFNYVPFDVLLTEKPDFESSIFKKLPYLVNSTICNYHYSAALLLLSEQNKPQEQATKILGFASSYQTDLFVNKKIKNLREADRNLRAQLIPLPGAVSEVAYLESRFFGDYYTGNKSSEQQFKNKISGQHYSVIHLAMHGIVDAQNPSYSSLAFTYSSDTIEDDFLYAYELNSLNLDADLVVLSACETGFGKYERGEGVVSIGRGFMYAGAPSLVMTLWPINDKATSMLIKDFYEYLCQGKPKDEALRLAKLDYIRQADDIAAHPFFWASFINVGNNSPLSLTTTYPWGTIVMVALVGLVLIGLFFRFRKR